MFEKVHKLSFKILYLFHRDFFYLNYRKLCETFPFSFTKVFTSSYRTIRLLFLGYDFGKAESRSRRPHGP